MLRTALARNQERARFPGNPGKMEHRATGGTAGYHGDVCFGHSHRAFVGRVGRVLFVNPGGAGRKRFSLPRSVALLDLAWPEARAEIVPLSPP
jgi:Calcineurin-like phosphoesterase superfamily domain